MTLAERQAQEWAFAYRLAGHLKMTVASLVHTMTAREFFGWMFFYQDEPFGAAWENMNFAQVQHVMTALHSKTPVPVQRFMFRSRRQRAKDGMQQIEAWFDSMQAKAEKGGDQ